MGRRGARREGAQVKRVARECQSSLHAPANQALRTARLPGWKNRIAIEQLPPGGLVDQRPEPPAQVQKKVAQPTRSLARRPEGRRLARRS